MTEQRRGRRLAMAPQELDGFLAAERTCRVATVSADGRPHNTPLWFVWDGSALWLYSIVASKRWADISHRPATSVVIDTGREFGELRGAELIGELRQVGDAPRTSRTDPELDVPERLFAAKYAGGVFMADGRHGWLRLRPETVVSWDFRKMPR